MRKVLHSTLGILMTLLVGIPHTLYAANCLVTSPTGTANGSFPQAASDSNCTSITFDVDANVTLTDSVTVLNGVVIDGLLPNGNNVTITGALGGGKPLLKLPFVDSIIRNVTLAHPGSVGVQITGSSHTISQSIIENGTIGVAVITGIHNRISKTRFRGNTTAAIRFNNGGNNDLPPPALLQAKGTTATTWSLSGTTNSQTATIEIYQQDPTHPTIAQGAIFVGTVSTTNGAFTLEQIPTGTFSPDQYYTGIAIDAVNNTSTFGQPFQPSSDPDFDTDLDPDQDDIPSDGDDSGTIGDNPCNDGETITCDDNCPLIANPTQADVDDDGLGDACDPDSDNDGILDDGDASGMTDDQPCTAGASVNCDDNCRFTPNPDQLDENNDGIGDLCADDQDGDGVPNTSDNCPTIPNAGQANLDGDTLGDACDDDTDGDGIPNTSDNCPVIANSDQANADNDALGDLCDDDQDGDGMLNPTDNCPAIPNPNQTNSDTDAVGDACDNCHLVSNADQADTDNDGVGNLCDNTGGGAGVDTDGDTILDINDNCPFVANPNQLDANDNAIGDACEVAGVIDTDGDGVVDAADNCEYVKNAHQADANTNEIGDLCEIAGKLDTDGDGIPDSNDNCPYVHNLLQLDSNQDGIGDACESGGRRDDDADGVANDSDNCPFHANGDQMDVDGDGRGDICDNCFNFANPNQNDINADGVGDLCTGFSGTISPDVTTPVEGVQVQGTGCTLILR